MRKAQEEFNKQIQRNTADSNLTVNQELVAVAEIKSLMEGLYGDTLPPGLPAWSTLARMDIQDVMAIVKARREVVANDRSDISAMQVITTPVPVPGGEDDCLVLLHPARFFRGSLAPPKDYWGQVPISHEPALAMIQVDHLALENIVSPTTVRKIHNRAAVITTKHLLASNANVEARPPVSKKRKLSDGSSDELEFGFVHEWAWLEPDSTAAIQEGMATYVALMQALHPVDYGPVALLSTLINFQWITSVEISPAEQRRLLSKYIDAALVNNASKAGNKQPPLTSKMLDDLALDTLRNSGFPAQFPHVRELWTAAKPTGQKNQQTGILTAKELKEAITSAMSYAPQQQNQRDSPGRGKGRGRGSPGRGTRGRRGGAAATGAPKIMGQFNGEEICTGFGRSGVCVRSTGPTCTTQSGVVLFHKCGICGGNHPQCNHV